MRSEIRQPKIESESGALEHEERAEERSNNDCIIF